MIEDNTHPSSNAVHSLILPQHLSRISIILCKFLDYIRAGIAKLFLDLLGDSELILRWDIGSLSSVSEKLLYESRNVSTGNGDMLDARSDHITFGLTSKASGLVSLLCIAEGIAHRAKRQAGRTTGITWVTPSPESMTVPVNDRSSTFELSQVEASARTACTAIWIPAALKV
jgi:hypothetical protein